MRITFTNLQSKAHDHTQTSSSDTTINTFLKDEINNAAKFIYAELGDYISQKRKTTSTVADQQYYHYPPDLKDIEAVKITVGNVDYDLEVVDNESTWNRINAIDFTGTAIFHYFFPRQSDFGIWPEPQDSHTMTLTYSYMLKDMSAADYTTGTVSVTNGNSTVTGSGTTFTSAMVGRWFKVDDDGYWYKIASFTNSTSIELENVYQGSTASGESYTIGETPDIPPEAHEILPYRAAARYFMSKKKNADMGQYWENMFMTGDGFNTSRNLDDVRGGLLGLKKRYASRSNSGIVNRKKVPYGRTFWDKHWATTISDSA